MCLILQIFLKSVWSYTNLCVVVVVVNIFDVPYLEKQKQIFFVTKFLNITHFPLWIIRLLHICTWCYSFSYLKEEDIFLYPIYSKMIQVVWTTYLFDWLTFPLLRATINFNKHIFDINFLASSACQGRLHGSIVYVNPL